MALDFIIGRKIGMTRIFDNLGSDYPVTVIEAGPCAVTQIKSKENEGYFAVQMGFINKSKGHSIKFSSKWLFFTSIWHTFFGNRFEKPMKVADCICRA